MLEQLEISNFKCFESLKLPLSPLTLLSGTNASGKSSILHSLVLLHQTMREHEWSTRLMLNGKIAQLGTVTDVVDQVTGRDSFAVGLVSYGVRCHWVFAGDRDDMSLSVDSVEVSGKTSKNPSALRHLLPIDSDESARSLTDRVLNLTYITAEREGPREFYPLEDQHGVHTVGPEGENAVSILFRGRDERISSDLLVTGFAPTLLRQVEARLGAFFPGCALEVHQIPNANAVILGIRISPDTRFLRPIHCGFGITQVLPIIVAVLSARNDSLFLIENPEVHLHPGGQALMGQFLADVARGGVQIIVETHSDHILNGIRRSVKARRLRAEEVAIHFLRERSPGNSQVLSPIIDDSGNIDVWPEGFFRPIRQGHELFRRLGRMTWI